MQTLGCLPLLLAALLLFTGVSSPGPSMRASEGPVVVSSSLPATTLAISAFPQMEPEPKGDALIKTYVNALNLAVSAGAHGMYSSFTWKSLEPSAAQFKLDDINGMAYAASKGLSSLLGITLINTTAKETPDDLMDVPFDSPKMSQRFHALIDALMPDLNFSVRYMSIGNEVDVYLNNHHEWEAYQKFYEDALAYVHQKAPWISVGVTCTFGGASGNAQKECATLNAKSDVIILTYYPLDATFKPLDPSVPLTDFPKMIELAGGKPVVLQEVGYPAGEVLDSSEHKQAEFVRNAFTAWRAAGGNIPFLNYFLLHDFTQKMCDDFGKYYGLPDSKNFNVFLCTLGLRKADGTPREAWQVFVDEGNQPQ
jgi:hypothetical protein